MNCLMMILFLKLFRLNETIKYPVIEFGKNYFIKVAGKYLTNNNRKVLAEHLHLNR